VALLTEGGGDGGGGGGLLEELAAGAGAGPGDGSGGGGWSGEAEGDDAAMRLLQGLAQGAAAPGGWAHGRGWEVELGPLSQARFVSVQQPCLKELVRWLIEPNSSLANPPPSLTPPGPAGTAAGGAPGAGGARCGAPAPAAPDVVALLIGIYGGTGPFLEEYRWGAAARASGRRGSGSGARARDACARARRGLPPGAKPLLATAPSPVPAGEGEDVVA
jgi:hypothetical protein